MKFNLFGLLLLLVISYSCENENKKDAETSIIRFENIKYYKNPITENERPYKYRMTYYFENGTPFRWIELDSAGRMTTDYIYVYDTNWTQTGARYREESAVDFSIEKVSYRNDSTQVTEWIDSIGNVYYTMIDNLNKQKKTYRAEFIGDRTHGYDSTFYNDKGFVERIFFTNTKGKVYNDRSFKYDSINNYGDWTLRKKIMDDTIREVQKREVHYNNYYSSDNGKFYEGIISTAEISENVISFTNDESVVFLTRTSDWANQSAYIAHKTNGAYVETVSFEDLDTIYNGAISPNGNQIIFTTRNADQKAIWLLKKQGDTWSEKINLTASSGITGGYFNWLSDSELYFQSSGNQGDIVKGKLVNDILTIEENLIELNTLDGAEFSPFVERNERFIIFTRYIESDPSQQGFFISYNTNVSGNPEWSKPEKLEMLPYGWSAFIVNENSQFIYTDGDDIYSVPIDKLKIKKSKIK
ncbi:MAG: hypothetical protein HKN54_00760 [Flavobacteriaceae bacterium]|nr:hypothetical protein [Flavobacteriaceae bacterium]